MNTAVTIVAHPDDCVIFGWTFMHHHPGLAWSIVYLTYTADSDRGRELREFWNQRRIPTTFLGFRDDYQDQEQGRLLHWTREQAQEACWTAVRDADLVLTHAEDGDYGHIHHCVVHDAVTRHPRLVTFAPVNDGDCCYHLPADAWQDHELPRHASIVRGFHPGQHVNSYAMSQDTARWLEEQRCI